MAFTKKIPSQIWLGNNDHTTKVRGDSGFRFEEIEKSKGLKVLNP
jgi:hypothetical protein